MERLLLRHALVTEDELASGQAAAGEPHPRRLPAARVPEVLASGGPTDRPISAAARFQPGDRVRARLMHPKTHTRMPGYLTGHFGVIEADRGGFVLPDTNAHGDGENPERLYTVIFAAAQVWGQGAEPGVTISADLWESYLDPA